MSDLGGYAGDATRDLIEQAHQLQELTAHPGWGVLIRLSGDAILAHERRLTSGRLEDLHEYKFLAGWLDGARQLLAIPETVSKQLQRAQEDESERVRVESEQPTEYAASDG